MNRKQLLSSLNRQRTRLIKMGAIGGQIDEAFGKNGASTKKLSDYNTNQLQKMYNRSTQYGSLTVVAGAVLPKEYISRVKAMAKFRGNEGKIYLKKSFTMATQGYIMTEHSSKENMLRKQSDHAKSVQKDYTQALKTHGLNKEAHKISQMGRKTFYKFLNEVGYYGTFKFVYASKQENPYESEGVMNIKKAINSSSTYQQYTPNFKYKG